MSQNIKTRAEFTEDEKLSSVLEKNQNVKNALHLLKEGFSPDNVASHLSWKEFELFISDVFEEFGFNVYRSFYIKKPKTQIDIVAEREYVMLCVDCKHYMKQYSLSSISKIAKKQKERASLIRVEINPSKRIVPVIVTLREDYPKYVGHVPIVPVILMAQFLRDVTGMEEEISVF